MEISEKGKKSEKQFARKMDIDFAMDFASYADNNTCCIHKTAEEVIAKLEKSSESIFEWFENNRMKANPDKCYLLLSKN